MTESMFEIRICENCGLRYPLVKGQTFGSRCPNCMGATRIALSRKLIHEPGSTTARYAPNPASGKIGFAVLLDNIRSAWNVGSVFRSADGFGFSHAYLCGITPTPEIDAVKKTSLGAEDSVPWSYHRDAVKLVKGLKREGRQIVGLEEDVKGAPLGEGLNPTAKHVSETVLIVGNEVIGIDPELLDLCDRILTIPMRGGKKSLNASIAFGVAAYALTLSK